MANLAIKGHATRGKEVIEVLEMLGGCNYFNLSGKNGIDTIGYHIGQIIPNIAPIRWQNKHKYTIFTLEKFLERFPYKVGDKVWLHYENLIIRTLETIISMHWDNKYNCILYDVATCCNLKESAFTPYKEETMENKNTISHTTEINLNHPCFNGHNEIELIIPKDWKFEQRDGKMFGVRKQYPKTYEESCEILNIPSNGSIAYIGNWVYGGEYLEKHLDRLRKFQQLLICRDAYWKIAGDQMGLGKPWKPRCDDGYQRKWIIFCQNGINFTNCFKGHFVLAFPTAEMRDAFLENFKNLIESCKELL